jgi:hypothetical protein
MNRARSFFLVCAGLLCLALLLPPAAAAYQQTDLQGIWESNGLASGPGAPWWERARTTVAADGSFTALTTDSEGGADTFQGWFTLWPTGIVTLAGSNTFLGVLDADQMVLVVTDTWSSDSPGTTELKVALKMAGTYGLSDLRGAWELNSIASGPGAPWWTRGRLTVAADGSFSGTLIDNQGEPDPQASTFSISPDGIVTMAASSTARGAMDAGRSVLVMSSTWAGGSPGTTDLGVGVKMAGTYSLADLVGRWEINGLATGPGAPWWSRGHFTVAADGSFTGSTLESDGGGGPLSGTFSISPAGVITLAGSSTARGVLDAGKTVMVWTSVWSTRSPGTTELDVATKMSGGTTAVPGEATLGFALDPVRPNPTRGGALTVHFVLPSAAPARVDLLDVRGRRVAGREVGSLGAGRHVLDLGEGRRLAPGLYLVRLQQGTNLRVARVMVLE